MTSRAYTEEEVRMEFLNYIAGMAYYWAKQPGLTDLEKCNGLAFSVLTLIDGGTFMPSFDLIPCPHEEDKDFHIEEGENWYEPTVINNCQLHELWHEVEIKK